MRSIVAAAVLLALPITAQAQFRSQPMPAADARLPGIVDRTPPGGHRTPGFIEVRIVPGDRTTCARRARPSTGATRTAT